jgi:hypothetical protein
MTTFLAVAAGIITFFVTQFIGAILIALLGSTHRGLYFIASYGPTKFVLRLLMWSACAWLGVTVFSGVVG